MSDQRGLDDDDQRAQDDDGEFRSTVDQRFVGRLWAETAAEIGRLPAAEAQAAWRSVEGGDTWWAVRRDDDGRPEVVVTIAGRVVLNRLLTELVPLDDAL